MLFDPVMVAGVGSTRTITVRNVGNAGLTLDGLTVPPGFTVIDGLASYLAPGEADLLTLRMDTAPPGLKSGEISFVTNDDDHIFNFPIKGFVTGLTVTLSQERVSEHAGVAAASGTVTRSAFELDRPMTVYLSGSDASEARVPAVVTIEPGATSAGFLVDAVDDAIPDDDPPTSWQNPSHPCDVNDDHIISAADVLCLINEINLTGAWRLLTPPSPPDVPPPFLDPTGDHELSPSDVLFIINYINSHSTVAFLDRSSSGGGEGEGGWPTTPPAPQVLERAAPAASVRSLGAPIMDSVPSRAASRAEAVSGSGSSPVRSSVTHQHRIATEAWLPLEEVMGEIADTSEIVLGLAIR